MPMRHQAKPCPWIATFHLAAAPQRSTLPLPSQTKLCHHATGPCSAITAPDCASPTRPGAALCLYSTPPDPAATPPRQTLLLLPFALAALCCAVLLLSTGTR